MSYTVVWLTSALDQIIPLLGQLQGTELSIQFIEAMIRIEERLEDNAEEEGESRSGINRILFEWYLIIDYEVHQPERVAAITQVRFRA